MPLGHSPTVRRRRLAAELRKLRESASMTCEEVAERIECSPSKISRMETGQVGIHPRDVRELMKIYGAGDDHANSLIAIAREARKRGWWHAYFGVLPKLYLTYIGLEAEAGRVQTYEPQLIPGLLQTEAYARELHLRHVGPPEDDPDKFIAARLARQALLRGDDPLRLWALLDEAVLRRRVGGPEVMAEQLRHMAVLGTLPNVTIQVIPFTAGAHAAMGGAFSLLEFPDQDDPAVVYLEHHTSSLYLEEEREIVRYRVVFSQALSAALDPGESLEVIGQVARELQEHQ